MTKMVFSSLWSCLLQIDFFFFFPGGGQLYMWGKIKNTGDDWMYPKPLMDLRFCSMFLWIQFLMVNLWMSKALWSFISPCIIYHACHFLFSCRTFSLLNYFIYGFFMLMYLFLFTQWMEFKMHGLGQHAPFCGCR